MHNSRKTTSASGVMLKGAHLVVQLGTEGVNMAAMQGLQRYLQANGSQGLPNNLLHGHSSMQGKPSITHCVDSVSLTPKVAILLGSWPSAA